MKRRKRTIYNREKIERWIFILGVLLFCFYMVFLLWRVFFYAYGNYYRSPGKIVGYNLIPFRTIGSYIKSYLQYNREIWFFNLFGNVAAFMPFGFLLPIVVPSVRRINRVILATALFSLSIEVVQFLGRIGTFDVDDIILNTLGGGLGYLVLCLLYFSFERCHIFSKD